jgi:hypothetical protein
MVPNTIVFRRVVTIQVFPLASSRSLGRICWIPHPKNRPAGNDAQDSFTEKTTTINMILGVLQPDSGSIHVEGMDLATCRGKVLGTRITQPFMRRSRGI